MEKDDCYDRNQLNELNSQVYLFQGALSGMNDFVREGSKVIVTRKPKLY